MAYTLLLCLLAPAAALRGSSDLLMDMRPEVVSKLLGEVTEQWVADFVGVFSNKTDSAKAYASMEKSCVKVSKSVIAGSDGDEDRVNEYMKEVCDAPAASKMCTSFASGVDAAMIGDANFNRNSLNLVKFCKNFWDKDVQTAAQAKKVQIDADEKATAEKKAADEKAASEKKAEDEKAAAEKKAADEKAAAEKKVVDDKAAAEKKVADDAAAAEKKATDEKAAVEKQQKSSDDQRAKSEKLRGAIKAKTEKLSASINKTAASVEEKYNATEGDVAKLVEHAHQAMKLASKKEEAAVQKAKEAKAAKVAAAAPLKNTTAPNTTAPAKEAMPADVAQMMNVNLTKEVADAKKAGQAAADAIVAKATNVTKVAKATNVTKKVNKTA